MKFHYSLDNQVIETERPNGMILKTGYDGAGQRRTFCAYGTSSPRVVHMLEAVEDAEIIEVSTPQLDDVVRLEDRYGRVGDTAP